MFAVSLTIIATIITYIIDPAVKGVIESLDDDISDKMKQAEGMTKVWSYIINNGFMIPLQMFILALIPIQFLYSINIIKTAIMPGILYGIAFQLSIGKGLLDVLIPSIPHVVFEIFAYCLLAAILLELNQVIRSKIKNIFKKDKNEVSFFKKVLKTIKIYGCVILPIIIIAAFLETYVANMMITSLFN